MQRRLLAWVCVLGVTACALGCEQAQGATLVTYNVGLARGFVDYADQRAEPVAQAIAALDADVVCLQEVWLREEVGSGYLPAYEDTILAATAATFPHHFSEITLPTPGTETGCNAAEAGPLQTCAEAMCAGVDPGELAGCALMFCGDEYRATSAACQTCIASNLGNPIDVIIDRCLGDGGGAFSNGHNGLLLLSRHMLGTPSLRRFESTITVRSVLHARVALPGVGPTDVYCTHLAADLSSILDYPVGTYSSFAEEQAAQVQALLAFVDETAGTGTVVIMGDMNHGPDELPENYAAWAAAGYASPYANNPASQCTYCPDNLLNAESTTTGETIDHVLFDSPSILRATSERLFTEPLMINDAEGTPVMTHLSDHYGVSVTLVP